MEWIVVVESSAKDPSDEVVASDFVRSFEYNYGSRHPQFVELGWKAAAQMAEQQSKLLFAYVHAPEHEVEPHRFSACALRCSFRTQRSFAVRCCRQMKLLHFSTGISSAGEEASIALRPSK